MTSTAPWLSRQRKSDLVEMADNAGMTKYVACHWQRICFRMA